MAVGERVPPGVRIGGRVIHVEEGADGLLLEPFARVAWIDPGPLRQLGRGGRPAVRQRAVQASRSPRYTACSSSAPRTAPIRRPASSSRRVSALAVGFDGDGHGWHSSRVRGGGRLQALGRRSGRWAGCAAMRPAPDGHQSISKAERVVHRPAYVGRPRRQAERHPMLVGPRLGWLDAKGTGRFEPEPRVVRVVSEQHDHRPALLDGDRDRARINSPPIPWPCTLGATANGPSARIGPAEPSRPVNSPRLVTTWPTIDPDASTATRAKSASQRSPARRASTIRPSSVDGANAASTSDRIPGASSGLLPPDHDPGRSRWSRRHAVSQRRRPRAGRRGWGDGPRPGGCTRRSSRATR